MPPEATKSPYIVVRKSRIHGTGVFARTDIPAETRVIEYVGDRITKAESDRRYQLSWDRSQNGKGDEGIVYIFTLNKRHDIDGDVGWNTARYINHSCDPNCETDIIRGHIWIIAKRDIKKGEEFSYNYGYDIDAWEDHPCRCGSENCIGFIVDEDHWPKLRRRKRYKELMASNGNGRHG
ncbi:MAG: SET domain-containing protein-lysine N-methyltransferase [candidate division Zixibacteria bacterium]